MPGDPHIKSRKTCTPHKTAHPYRASIETIARKGRILSQLRVFREPHVFPKSRDWDQSSPSAVIPDLPQRPERRMRCAAACARQKINLRVPEVMFLADPGQVLPRGGRCATRCFSRLRVTALRCCQPFGQAVQAVGYRHTQCRASGVSHGRYNAPVPPFPISCVPSPFLPNT